jgi:hypothetical protein
MNKILLLIFAVFAYAGAVQAQVTAGSTSTGVMNNSNTAIISYNNTAGSNKLLVVSIAAQQPGAFVTGVTYNGQPLQQLINHFNNSQTRVNIWYMVNPPVGTFNVVVNNSQSDNAVIGVSSFTGVSQSNPFGAPAFCIREQYYCSCNCFIWCERVGLQHHGIQQW